MNTPSLFPFIYLRVSSDEQVKTGLGLAAQRTKCLAMAELKGWTVLEENIFIDEGISGTKGPNHRAALAALLDRLAEEKDRPVIVAALDRLGRKVKLTLTLIETITKYGPLISCNELLDSSSAIGRFAIQLFAALGELESARVGERTAQGLGEVKDRGHQYGMIPYGWQRGEQFYAERRGKRVIRYALVRNREEAATIEKIVAWNGCGLSTREIAARLNTEGIPTRGSKKRGTAIAAGGLGGKWSKTQVVRVLRNVPATNATIGNDTIGYDTINHDRINHDRSPMIDQQR